MTQTAQELIDNIKKSRTPKKFKRFNSNSNNIFKKQIEQTKKIFEDLGIRML